MKSIALGLLLASLTTLNACRKKENAPSTAGSDSVVTIYASGAIYDGTINAAAYWKNDTVSLLPVNASADTASYGWAIAASPTDVYVTGTTPEGAVVWKDEQEQILSATGKASAIALAGTDVYVAGSQLIPASLPNVNAIYWKNGQPVLLSPNLPTAAANGIAISGGDVYVCGYGLQNGVYYQALYWKNGTPVWMAPDTPCSPSSILVNGADVYVAGSVQYSGINFFACYWKNGQLVQLAPDSLGVTTANGMAMLGNDLYVTGSLYNQSMNIFTAVYWKNGQLFRLTDPSVASSANCIAIYGNDVYIGGNVIGQKMDSQGNPIYNAAYWKNGGLVQWPYNGSNGIVYSIVVTAVKN